MLLGKRGNNFNKKFMFENKYKDKKVLITGHTGFKGSWLTVWLLKLGAKVCGVSDQIPTNPSMFEKLGLECKIENHYCDIRDLNNFYKILNDFNPDFIFHLAAQPIVSLSYEDPLNTISTNVMGTAVLLESLKQWNQDCNVVIITSDKCYENVEWVWGYKETDHLGGKDIYSGSKGAAEIIFHAYYHSFFKNKENKIRIATGRAGNVIGGGDWAKDRIVVDCIKNWAEDKVVEIRSPNSTRPWQHVLEPLSGYLTLGAQLDTQKKLLGESFNFGPRSEQNRTVLELLTDLSKHWKFSNINEAYIVTDNIPFHEAGLLKLNCDKALYNLKWEANLTYFECVNMVGEWYYNFYKMKNDMYKFTNDQISKYENLGKEKKLIWTTN
jgi:CDP-glucose 4,6-dehydratase